MPYSTGSFERDLRHDQEGARNGSTEPFLIRRETICFATPIFCGMTANDPPMERLPLWVMSGSRTAPCPRLLFPQQRTSRRPFVTSEKCQSNRRKIIRRPACVQPNVQPALITRPKKFRWGSIKCEAVCGGGPSTPSVRPIVCWRSRVGRCRQAPSSSSSARTGSISSPPAWSASATLWHPEHSDAWRSDSRRIEFRIGRRDGQTGNATHPRQGAHVPLIGLAQSRSPGLVICNQRIHHVMLSPNVAIVRCAVERLLTHLCSPRCAGAVTLRRAHYPFSSRRPLTEYGSRTTSHSSRSVDTKNRLVFAISPQAMTGSGGGANRPPRAKYAAHSRSVVHGRARTRRRPQPRNTVTRSGNAS